MASTTKNPIATITNKSDYDLTIYDTYNDNTDPKTYKNLTYTSVATVKAGAVNQQVKTIRFASQLQAMYSGKIASLNDKYFLQFPVAVLAVSEYADSNSFTITNDSLENMVKSFKFHKYISANPDSKMAKGFRAALTNKKSQKDAVNKFFKANATFKDCTIVTYTAVLTWQSQFKSPWQGIYYLYTMGSKSSSRTESSGRPALWATLTIASGEATDTPEMKLENTGQSVSVEMTGDGNMEEKNHGLDELSVVLTPVWMNTTTMTKKDDKDVLANVIGVAFKGTIGEYEVVGNLNKRNLPDPKDPSKKAKAVGDVVAEWWSRIVSAVGALAAVGMLFYSYKGHKVAQEVKDMKAEKMATSKAEAKKNLADAEKKYQGEEVDALSKEAAKVDSSKVPESYKALRQSEEIGRQMNTLELQERKLVESLEAEAPSQLVEDTAQDLSSAADHLAHAVEPGTSSEQRAQDLTDASAKLKTTGENLKTQLADDRDDLTEAQESALKETSEALETRDRQIEEAEDIETEQDEQNEQEEWEEIDLEGSFEEPEPFIEEI